MDTVASYLFLRLLIFPSPLCVRTLVEALSCSAAVGRSRNCRISFTIESCSLQYQHNITTGSFYKTL